MGCCCFLFGFFFFGGGGGGGGQVRIKSILLPNFTLKIRFQIQILDFVDTVYVSLSFNDSNLCLSFLICF